MKPILATIALLFLLGCQSKPRAGNIIWVKIHHPYVIPCKPELTCEYYPFMDPVNLGIGSISHVTPAQWEAAQGLYNPHHVKGFMVSGPWTSGTMVTCTGCTVTSTATGTVAWSSAASTKSPCGDTFPPSGDAR